VKAILVHRGCIAELESHLAELDIRKRALSLPAPGAPASPVAAFVELWDERKRLSTAIARWPAEAGAWWVEENLPAAYERNWADGAQSPGVRLVSSVHRLSHQSREEFARYWRNEHATVALSYTIPVWHYSQNVVLEALGPDANEDGFAVLHFRSAKDMQARWANYPDEAKRGAEDAARFLDAGRAWAATMLETVWGQD
jgi:hypothetical protein